MLYLLKKCGNSFPSLNVFHCSAVPSLFSEQKIFSNLSKLCDCYFLLLLLLFLLSLLLFFTVFSQLLDKDFNQPLPPSVHLLLSQECGTWRFDLIQLWCDQILKLWWFLIFRYFKLWWHLIFRDFKIVMRFDLQRFWNYDDIWFDFQQIKIDFWLDFN